MSTGEILLDNAKRIREELTQTFLTSAVQTFQCIENKPTHDTQSVFSVTTYGWDIVQKENENCKEWLEKALYEIRCEIMDLFDALYVSSLYSKKEGFKINNLSPLVLVIHRMPVFTITSNRLGFTFECYVKRLNEKPEHVRN